MFAYPNNNICLTKGCITAASNVINAMDTTVNPCDNFYNFACGNFIKKSNLLDEYDYKSVLSYIKGNVNEQLRTIVSAAINRNDSKPYQLVKKYYSQCMNLDFGIDSFWKLVDSFGGWPIFKGDNWDAHEFDFAKIISEIQKYQFDNYLFTLNMKKEGGSTNIYLSRSIPSKNLYSAKRKYRDYMVDMISLFGVSIDENVQSELDDILVFEKLLEDIMEDSFEENIEDNEDGKEEDELKITLEEFQAKNNYLDWKDHINKNLPKTIEVDETQIIHVTNLKYFKRLGKLIASIPERTLANYLMWNLAKTSAEILSYKIHDLDARYNSRANSQIQEQRWQFCLYLVKKK